MPIEVALSSYGSNYAASQGARTDWNRVSEVDRDYFTSQFYGPIIKLYVQTEAAKGNLGGDATTRLAATDPDMYEALIKSKFIGMKMMNIDPVKEVKAWREKLGPAAANIPFATADEAIEALSKGDFDSTLDTFSAERERFQTEIGDQIIEDQREKITQVQTEPTNQEES